MARSTATSTVPSHGWKVTGLGTPSDMSIGSGIPGRAAAARAVQSSGSGVAGSMSWPETIASRCVHDRGTPRTREYPPPPNASHRPPVTVSASSRNARYDAR